MAEVSVRKYTHGPNQLLDLIIGHKIVHHLKRHGGRVRARVRNGVMVKVRVRVSVIGLGLGIR
jgi:hypothetical protein